MTTVRRGSDAVFHEARTKTRCSCGCTFRESESLTRHVEVENDLIRRHVLALLQRLALIAGVV